jgi:hypothetical protein
MLKRTFNVLAALLVLQCAALAQISGGGTISTTGAITVGHCVSFASSTVIQDSGGVCGGAGSAPGGSSASFQFNSTGTFAGTTLTDLQYSGHTTTLGSTGIFNAAAASVTAGIVLPNAAGAAPTTDAVIAFNTTNHLPVFGSNGTTLTWPQTLGAAINNFLTSYSQTTGLFTQAQPAFTNLSGSLSCGQAPALTGDTTTAAGSCATTTTAINGTTVPTSAKILGTNGSAQPIAAALTSAHLYIGSGSNLPADVALSGDSSITNAGVMTNSGLNGVSLAGLATGILKNTTGTGVPSIATGTDVSSLLSNTFPITLSGAGSIGLTGTCSSLQVLQWNGSAWVCASATLPNASAQGQVPVASGAGTTYVAQTKQLSDTRDDPSAGANLCIRYNNIEAALQTAGLGFQSVDSRGEHGTTVQNCTTTNIDQPQGNWLLDGGDALQTDLGFNIGNFQQVIGVVENLVGQNGGGAGNNGTMILNSSSFPGTGAITATGTSTQTTVSLTKAGGGENILIAPGDRLFIAGDGTVYYVTKCTGTGAPCAGSTLPNTGTLNSQFYSLPSPGTITVNIQPALAIGPTAQAVNLRHPVVELGDNTGINSGTLSGTSNFFSRLQGSFIGCGSAIEAIGFEDLWGQENSWAKDVTIQNCAIGFLLNMPVNSGPYENLNVGYSSDANCSASGVVPFEMYGTGTEVRRVTNNGNHCNGTKQTSGLFHVTNVPDRVLSTFQMGGFDLHELHMEGCQSGSPGPVSCTTTADGILVDSVNAAPPGTGVTGPVSLHEINGCPSAAPCTNVLHIGSTFQGTLQFYNSICNNTAVMNAVKDDVNGNTMTCAHNGNGIGFYFLDGNESAFNNLNSVDMTKGTNLYNGTLAGYAGGSATYSLSAATGNVTATGAINFRLATHTGVVQTGLIANIPATCTAGDLYFATDQTHGQSLNECYAGNTWVQQLNSGASGANQALSNLSGVAVNASLIPGAGVDNGLDLGSASLRWRNLYLGSSIIWTNGSGAADTGLCRGAAGQVDVSSGGACGATGNLFAAGFASGSATVPGTGEISLPSSAAPSAPASGTLIWFDSTDLRVHEIGNAATIGTTSVAKTCSAHQWMDVLSTAGVFTCAQPAVSDLTATFTSPLTLSTNTLSISGVTGEQGTGALLQLSTGTVNLNRVTKFDTNGNTVNSDFLESSNTLSNSTTTQTSTIQGGGDASANSILGGLTLRGADETGAGGATSQGGGTLIRGGNNAATNAASQAGGIELLAGASTGATQGLQGPFIAGINYVKGGGTSTLWNLQCGTGSAMTVNDCGASPNNILGVAEAVNSNTVVTLFGEGQTFVNASAAVTLNHTVCASGTGGKVTDSGGTATCTNAQGETVGIVIATSGAWTLPDGVTATASTTLPLIQFSPGVTIPTTAGAPSLDAVTGSTAQVTRSESGAGDNYTFNGVETATLTSYIVIQDTNSTNNNASVGLISNCAGTSTGCIGLVANSVSGTGDLFRLYAGSTVTNGTLTGGTKEFSVAASGAASINATTNQILTGTGANITTSSYPASSGAVTLTFPNTTTNVLGGNSDTTTSHVLHATATGGIGNFSAIVVGDLPGSGATTVNGQSCALNATCAIESATSGQVAISGGSGAALTGAADLTYATHTFSGISTTIFDLSAATGTAAFKVPSTTTNTATAAGVIDYDTTNSNYHGNSGADSIFGIFPTASVPVTGDVIDASVASSKVLLHDSGFLSSNVVRKDTTNAGAAAMTLNMSASTSAPSVQLPAVVGGTILSGTSTVNLSAPIEFRNTNSSNNNTSITAIFNSPGTSTGQTTVNINGTTTQGDLLDIGTGATVVAGAISGQTIVAAFTPTGLLKLGTAPTVTTPGTGFAIFGTEGTEPASIGASTDGLVADSTSHCLEFWANATNVGCGLAETTVIAANIIPKANGTAGQLAASLLTDNAKTLAYTGPAGMTINTIQVVVATGSPVIQTPLNAIGIFNPTALPATFANATQSLAVGTQYGPPGVIDKSIGVTTAAMGAQTSATCTNVTGMSWPLAANKNYLLRCEVPMTLAASATIQYCIGGPGTATSYSLIAEGDLGTAGIWSQISTLAQTAYSTKTGASASVAATSVQHVWAQIQNGSTASGIPLTLQTAANGTNAITVLANASCTLNQEN